ncbi:MAG: hypothetical protein SNJ29_16455 [Rikenellaceae bacterium]
MILDLAQDPELKPAIVYDITNRDSDFINDLPDELLTFAVSIFGRNTKDDYRINYEYLGVIAVKGMASQKNELADLLCNKINECSDIEDRLNIFDKLPKLSNNYKNANIALGLKNYLCDNEIDAESEIASRINIVITKFS